MAIKLRVMNPLTVDRAGPVGLRGEDLVIVMNEPSIWSMDPRLLGLPAVRCPFPQRTSTSDDRSGTDVTTGPMERRGRS